MSAYFSETGKSRFGDLSMFFKTFFMLSLFFVPFVAIYLNMANDFWELLILYMISGIGMSGIGMGVMHDAIHGTYSSNPTINKVLSYSLNLIGANANVWKIQHNVLHHTFTNIDEADDDINVPPYVLRFSPHTKRYGIHKFQHLYVWFLYGISTLIWVTVKDYVRLLRYNKLGLFKQKSSVFIEIIKISAWKLVYFSYSLFLPILVCPFPWYQVIIAFIGMHFITGVLLSMVFQTAHVMPENEFPKPTDGKINANWLVHQLETTTNFSPKSRVFSWLIGGLNFQVEHHLFPNICHIHYRDLSSIVRDTAKEFGVKYQCKNDFMSAVADHIKMLKLLGTKDLMYQR